MSTKLLTTSLALLCCGLAAVIVSCSGDDANVADAPNNPSRGGRTPQLFAEGCNSTLAVNRCGVGGASLSYESDNGELTVSGLNTLEDGISSTFDNAHNWQQRVRTRQSDGNTIAFTAFDQDARESEFTVAQGEQIPGVQTLAPAFYAGSGVYDVEVYRDGELVASQRRVEPSSPPVQARAQSLHDWWEDVKFTIYDWLGLGQRSKGTNLSGGGGNEQIYGACAWIVSNSSTTTSITLPDGTTTEGNEIRFVESVDEQNRYPYHTVSRVDVRADVGKYTVVSEYAGR